MKHYEMYLPMIKNNDCNHNYGYILYLKDLWLNHSHTLIVNCLKIHFNVYFKSGLIL